MSPSRQVWGAILGGLVSGAAMGAEGSTGAMVPVSSAETSGPVAILHGASGSVVLTRSPSSQYVVAYDSMIQADWLKKQGMPDEAIELYMEAQIRFQQLAADHPLWEPNVVAFRITYCADALTQLRAAATAPTDVNVSNSPAPKPSGSEKAAPTPGYAGALRPGEPVNEARDSAGLRAALQKERGTDVKTALETYLTVLEEQPESRDALRGAGRCYLRLGMPENARILLQRGMDLPNPDAELSLLMALVYCHDREFYKAYQLLLIVIHQQPTNAMAHLAMGVAQAGLDKLNDARIETQKAIQLDPKLGDAYYNLARLSLKLTPSNVEAARGHYFNAIRFGTAPDPALESQLQ